MKEQIPGASDYPLHGHVGASGGPRRWYARVRRLLLVCTLLIPVVALTQEYEAAERAFESGDYPTAIKELQPLAEQGDVYAQGQLGAAYNNEGDLKKAITWWRRAADQGNARAQGALGNMYKRGHGVPLDYREAVKWYRLAAEGGWARAQVDLGYAYDRGEGVRRSDRQAVEWYRRAAEQGYAEGQVRLGNSYADGKGVSRDHQEAVRWYRRAAERGNAWAQTALGDMYADGKGVPQDYQSAHMFYSLAAAGRPDRFSYKQKDIASQLTPTDLAKAELMAQEWLKAHKETLPLPRKKTLHDAARDGDIERVRDLIKAGEDVSRESRGRSPLEVAVQRGRRDEGQSAVVEFLISHGADTDTRDRAGKTLLHHAVSTVAPIVRHLLDAGVDVNATDNSGNTPLSIAVQEDDDEIFFLLLDHGADIELKGYSTPLISATMNGHVARIEKLLDAGADVNGKNGDGHTALLSAFRIPLHPNLDAIRLLLDRGAVGDIEDHDGNLPLALAQQAFEGFLAMEDELMEMAGAEENSRLTRVRLRQIKSDYQQVISLLKSAGVNDVAGEDQ